VIEVKIQLVNLLAILSLRRCLTIYFINSWCLRRDILIIIIVDLFEDLGFVRQFVRFVLNVFVGSHALFLQKNVEGYQMAQEQHRCGIKK
jgi:hypothetical protein